MYFKTETIVGAFILLASGLFMYMSLQLGSVRLNLARYATYTVDFSSVSNLVPAADVKIAGVKVGWVDTVYLDPKTMHVTVTFKLLKDYRLYKDASARVRQEGMLGVRFLEIIPGIADGEVIEQGGRLPYQDHPSGGIDDALSSISKLAQQIERLGSAVEESTHEATALLKDLRERLARVDAVFTDLGKTQQRFQEAASVVKKVGDKVDKLLAFTDKDGLPSPRGSLAKLIADDTLYEDIKATSDYARDCVNQVQRVGVGIDSHLEILPGSFREQEVLGKRTTDVKWYLDGYVASCEGYFGKIGLACSNRGFAKHPGNECDDGSFFRSWGHRNGIRLTLQVGKYWYPYGALRVGIFEGTAGVGVDWWIAYSRFKWLSTFEAFDFRGYNRFDNDRRPHLKWLNRLFLSDNVYLSFGADDFISRHNKTGFIGIGAYVSMPTIFGDC